MSVKKSISKSKKKLDNSNVESLDLDEIEDEGFFEGDVDFGTPVMAFNFSSEGAPQVSEVKVPVIVTPKLSLESTAKSDQITSMLPKGLTPPVDGEFFTVKRCYQYRPSTIRKLNELKARHSDVNAYLNTIIDEAILLYYDHVLNGKQK